MARRLLLKIYWKLQSIIVPGLKYSQTIYEDVLNEYSLKTLKWLDLGCGHQLLPPWRIVQEENLTKKQKLIVGVDYDYLSLTNHKTIKNKVRGDIGQLPFKNNTFDLITSNMVFEHLDNPSKQLKEISRLLVKGGRIIIHTPNKYGYTTLIARLIPDAIKARFIYILQGRDEDDVFPTFYKMNSKTSIEEIAASAGFKILSIKMICSSAQLAIIPPLVFFELIWIKFLLTKVGEQLRPNIIAVLEKS